MVLKGLYKNANVYVCMRVHTNYTDIDIGMDIEKNKKEKDIKKDKERIKIKR